MYIYAKGWPGINLGAWHESCAHPTSYAWYYVDWSAQVKNTSWESTLHSNIVFGFNWKRNVLYINKLKGLSITYVDRFLDFYDHLPLIDKQNK